MTDHSYKDEHDYSQMRRLIIDNKKNRDLSPYPSLGDLDFRRYLENTPDGIKKVHLWQNEEDKLLGFFWPDKHDPLMVCDYQNRELEDDMITWAEQHSRFVDTNSTEPIYQYVDAYDGDIQRTNMLRNRGYKKTEIFCYWGVRDLDVPIPPVSVKEGYTVRELREEEIVQRVRLHGIAAAGRTTSREQYHDLIKNSLTYRPDLDLVCVGLNGDIAAFCTLWFDAESKQGTIEPYGCQLEHRRKGLTYSLISEGLHRLKAAGAAEVFVAHGGCNSDHPDPALELNKKIGFKPCGRDIFWKRLLV